MFGHAQLILFWTTFYISPWLLILCYLQIDKEKAGVLVGTGLGGPTMFYDNVKALREKGCRAISPFFIPYFSPNMGSALLAIDIGFMGPNYSISTACATSNHCFCAAANHIRQGYADLMIAGGVDAAIVPFGLGGFSACRALSQRNDDPITASRPWDRDRDGFVLGEGSGVLVCFRGAFVHMLGMKAFSA